MHCLSPLSTQCYVDPLSIYLFSGGERERNSAATQNDGRAGQLMGASHKKPMTTPMQSPTRSVSLKTRSCPAARCTRLASFNKNQHSKTNPVVSVTVTPSQRNMSTVQKTAKTAPAIAVTNFSGTYKPLGLRKEH